MAFLRSVKPMGIYETLYAFQQATGSAMGEAGTHPWSQGYPRVDQLPAGPDFPNFAGRSAEQRMYPKAWGEPALRQAIADYYLHTYGAKLSPKNVMVFGGGRPALFSLLLFLERQVKIRIAATEYTPYWDMFQFLGRSYDLITSGPANAFAPTEAEIMGGGTEKTLYLMSNPCNPTGVTRRGSELQSLVAKAQGERWALLADEAYEWFVEGEPVSALQYVQDINASNLFVVGATTKNFQDPGLRLGWVVASEEAIDTLGNFSSFGMGGVSRPSQLEAIALMEPERSKKARAAVQRFYRQQRSAYGEALAGMGLQVLTGEGGFYHWCRLPGGMSADEFNQRLFQQRAAVLPGRLCDMARQEGHYVSPLADYFRFSFGPLQPESFAQDCEILRRALRS